MNIFKKHKECWLQKGFRLSLIFGIVFILVSFVANNYAQNFAASHVNNSESDILLDNLPVMDVHLIYSEGALLFLIVLLIILLNAPKYIPFILKASAIFIIFRSFFMILTHIAPPAAQIYIDPTDYIQRLSHGDDLFFSGHTGFPFLLAIVFWHKKYFKWLFLISTVIGGAAVILGHLHYSIDVFSALFISFGVFHIAKYFFPKDYALLNS